jgi:tetratricopeptide (TPR) repeat protein
MPQEIFCGGFTDMNNMKWRELIWSHKYADAIRDLRRHLANSPDDMAAVGWMADALRATGDYREALVFFERLAEHRRQDKVANIMAPGSAPWDIDIACLHSLCGDHAKAVQIMHGLAAGILDGSLQYSTDAAGGMTQGLLLYYMAVSDNKPEQMSFALDYMRNRLKHRMIQTWPCAVASYYLGDIPFGKVMDDVNERVVTMPPIDPATLELGRRMRLCDALFHAGVKSQALGDEANCLASMRECAALENPVVEQEWYLARYEVERAGALPRASPCG